ncbi:monocarboxylate uptake permease MctP [Paracidobacterium acidisoli]|nr:sodium:solute symporter [Paracidobacterium acidisoli]MBT9331941.1 sodium:solute symporter [Paracidobacterium acidisoli]
MTIHAVSITVFVLCFLLVTLAGFLAARWKRADLHSLEEWGLAGRRFGTVVTWFLIGGDFYTAYTIIAVPAALYGAGAYGFFAIPYCILLYPYMMLVLPRLWKVCHRHGYVTLADFVRGRFGSRWLAMAIAVTGILATMPYIALQLIGIQEVIAALGIHGEWPLIAAFVILAAYTYTSGLRAPAAIAIVKDIMLYLMVLAALFVLPARLGGYGHIFHAAAGALALHKPPASIILPPSQYFSYSTLAIGSAIAIVLYPHTATGVLSASSGKVLRRNAALLPAYNLLLTLIALLGFAALAAGIRTTDTSSVVPTLFTRFFPEWFSGFCLAAIGIGALVPAAIMSIASANLFTRNLYGELHRGRMTPQQEASQAKIVSLVVKFGALIFVLGVKSQYAIELQLLGGIWIAQLFPAVVLGIYTRWFHGRALLCGWAAGMLTGTGMALARDLKSSIFPLHLGTHHTYMVYAAVPALLVNLIVSAGITLFMDALGHPRGADATDAAYPAAQQV